MTIDRILTLATLWLLPALLLPDPARAQSFGGTFTGEGMMMTLQPARDRYYGTLVFDDQFYSIEAEEEGGELTGSFVTAKGEFDFRASFRGSRLELETNSITYVLRRSGEGPTDDPEPEDSLAAEPSPPAAAEPAATAGWPTEPEPAADPTGSEQFATTVAEAAEPSAEEPAARSGLLASMSFEDGVLPTPRTAAEPTAAAPEAAEPADADPMAVESAAAGPVDDALVGTWQREAIAADPGTLLAGVTSLELTADGDFIAGGAPGRGDWKAADRMLYLRPAGTEAWRSYCRYKVVVDSLLCTVDGASRQLWFRR